MRFNKYMYGMFIIYLFAVTILPSKFKVSGISVNGDVVLGLFILMFIIKIIAFKDERENIKRGMLRFLKDFQGLLILAICLLMFVSICYAPDKKLAVSETLRFITYAIMFFIMSFDKKEEKIIKSIVKAYAVLCLALSCFGIIQYLTGIGLDEEFRCWNAFGVERRIASTLQNPNALGAFIILAIFPIMMMCINEKDKKYKGFYGITTLLLLVNMILTFSRNALIAFIIGMAFLCVCYYKKMIYAFGVVLLSFLAIPAVRNRIAAVTDMSQNSSRISLWKAAVKMMEEHPVRGVGNGNYISQYSVYINKYPYLRYGGLEYYPTHNSYLKIGSELGITGLLIFLGFLVTSVKKMIRVVNIMDKGMMKSIFIGFNASFIAFLFMNISDNLFFVPKVTAFFWMYMGMVNFYYNSSENC